MLTRHTFTEHIVVLPNQLSDIQKNVAQTVMKRLNTCIKDYGYIKNISDIQCKENIISRTTGNCIFLVTYVATCLKPVEGETIRCKVHLVFPEGILVTHDEMRIIVPQIQLPVGTEVDVELKSIRYESSEYQCVGRVINACDE